MDSVSVMLVLAGAAGLYLFNLQRSGGNLTYFPGNITGYSLNGMYPTIYIDLVIQNTSNVTFTINSLAGNVLSDGTIIGNVSNFTPAGYAAPTIPGNTQIVLPLTLTLQPLTIVNELIGIITGGVGKRNLRIDGTVNANGIQSSFAMDYKLGV